MDIRICRDDNQESSYLLVEGSLVSTTYERANDKAKKAETSKQTCWCIRADVVRKVDTSDPATF